MKKIVVSLIALAVVVSLLLGAFGPPPDTTPKLKLLSISVPAWIEAGENATVTVTSEGQPVEGVTVEVSGMSKVTDADGAVNFTLKEPGGYEIRATKKGYLGTPQVLFHDDFSDSRQWFVHEGGVLVEEGWSLESEDGNSFLRLTDRFLRIAPRQDVTDNACLVWENYSIKVRFRLMGPALQVMFRYNTRGSYQVEALPDRIVLWKTIPIENYSVPENYAGSPPPNRELVKSEYSSMGTNWHEMEIMALGEKISVYLDGELLFSWVDTDTEFVRRPYLKGGIDLAGSYSDVDDVVIELVSQDKSTALAVIKVYPKGNEQISFRGAKEGMVDAKIIWVGPVPVTVRVSPHFGALLGIGFGADSPIAVNDINGYIDGGVEVSAGVDIYIASAGVYFDSVIYLYFVAVPSFGFDKVTVTAKVGVYVEVLGWRGELELWDGSWSSNPGTKASSQSEVEWKLNERNYLGSGYSTFAWTEGEREGVLVENVYSNPQPSLAVAENGSMVAAWTYDDPKKDFLLQALEIAYSIYDPNQGTWTTPVTITSDDFFDSSPKLAYMGDGRVLAVWQRVPYELENTVSPFAYVENIELAYSILDLNTGGWSTPQLITSNSTYEAPAALASSGGETCLVYLRDTDNNLFTLDNQILVAVKWAGESWGAEETIASGITVIGSPRLSLAGANDGILTFARDMDENLFTIADREIFYLRYDGSWGTPTRLTTDSMEERSPSAGRINNQWYLSWIEMQPIENTPRYTTSVRFGRLANGQLAESSSLLENQGATDQFLLGEIQHKLYLLYQVGARGTPRLIRYDGSAWENVENFQWSPKVENARTSQLSVSIGGNYLGAVGATEVQAGGGQTSMSLHASTFSIPPSEAPPEIAEVPWALIGGIIAAVLIMILIGAIVLVRKRGAKQPSS